MELTVTEPTFLWLMGLLIILVVVLLVLALLIGLQVLRLLRFTNEKSLVVGEAIDEVRSATHDASESMRTTSHHIAQFVNFTTSAAGLAKLIGSARDAWSGWSGKRVSEIIDEAIDETPVHRRSSKRSRK